MFILASHLLGHTKPLIINSDMYLVLSVSLCLSLSLPVFMSLFEYLQISQQKPCFVLIQGCRLQSTSVGSLQKHSTSGMGSIVYS